MTTKTSLYRSMSLTITQFGADLGGGRIIQGSKDAVEAYQKSRKSHYDQVEDGKKKLMKGGEDYVAANKTDKFMSTMSKKECEAMCGGEMSKKDIDESVHCFEVPWKDVDKTQIYLLKALGRAPLDIDILSITALIKEDGIPS